MVPNSHHFRCLGEELFLVYSGCLIALGLSSLEEPWSRKAAMIEGMFQEDGSSSGITSLGGNSCESPWRVLEILAESAPGAWGRQPPTLPDYSSSQSSCLSHPPSLQPFLVLGSWVLRQSFPAHQPTTQAEAAGSQNENHKVLHFCGELRSGKLVLVNSELRTHPQKSVWQTPIILPDKA